MKIGIQILGVALSLPLVFSCKKDADDANSASTKLSKVIVYAAVRPATTIAVYGYRYDAMNRVTEISYAQGDSANGEEQAKQYESIKWFYNGSEQKPYKSSGVDEGLLHYDKYYGYDNYDRLVYDSTVPANCNCYNVTKYKWMGNSTIRTYASGNFSGVVYSTGQDSISTSEKSQLGTFGSNPQTGEVYGSVYTYDNKVNPLHLLNIHVASTFTAIAGIPTAGYNENNNTEVAYGYFDTYGPGPVTFVKSQIISYKYNYNGSLPTDCEISGNTPFPSKVKFYYTN